MAPVYDFRHVEIDKIGRGKRVTRPPGGECSDIFGTVDQPDSGPKSPNGAVSPPNGSVNGGGRRGSHDTQHRLFGPPESTSTPRRSSVNRMKSSIFSEDSSSAVQRTPSAKKQPIGAVRRNPITGEMTAASPMNGHSNGHSCPATPETPNTNGDTPRQRPPPGGRSSGIF